MWNTLLFLILVISIIMSSVLIDTLLEIYYFLRNGTSNVKIRKNDNYIYVNIMDIDVLPSYSLFYAKCVFIDNDDIDSALNNMTQNLLEHLYIAISKKVLYIISTVLVLLTILIVGEVIWLMITLYFKHYFSATHVSILGTLLLFFILAGILFRKTTTLSFMYLVLSLSSTIFVYTNNHTTSTMFTGEYPHVVVYILMAELLLIVLVYILSILYKDKLLKVVLSIITDKERYKIEMLSNTNHQTIDRNNRYEENG